MMAAANGWPSALAQIVDNKLVLDRIFKGVEENPSKNLRSYRLARRSWTEPATKSLREKNYLARNFLVLRGEEDVQKYLETFVPSFIANTRVLRDGTRFAKSPPETLIDLQRIFYNCYKIFTTDYAEWTRLCLRKQSPPAAVHETFFRVFPQTVKSLEISMELGLNYTDLLDLILSSQSAELTELKILFNHRFTTQNSKKRAKKQQGEAGIAVPRLDYLCIAFDPSVYPLGEELNLMDILFTRIPPPIKLCLMDVRDLTRITFLLQKYALIPNLKILFLTRFNHMGTELRELANAGAKLQFLSTSVQSTTNANDFDVHSNSNTEDVYNFIETQLDNLECLSWGSNWRFKFPPQPMTALKKLRLIWYRGMCGTSSPWFNDPTQAEINWTQTCTPIVYANHFPALEVLEFKYPTFGQFLERFLPPQIPCYTLRTFSVNFGQVVTIAFLGRIFEVFPQIMNLRLSGIFLFSKTGERDFFQMLWASEVGQNLQKFSIEMNNCEEMEHVRYVEAKVLPQRQMRWRPYEVDSLFSGVEEKIIRQSVRSSDYEDDYPTDNSILNFKSLKSLTIHATPNFIAKGGGFTDYSAYRVFGKLDNLEFLHLDDEIIKFSRPAREFLQKKLRAKPIRSEPLSTEERIEKAFETTFESASGIVAVTENFRDLNLDL